MEWTGCGAQIAKIIDAVPYDDPIRSGDVAQQLAEQTDMPYDKAKAATNVKLKRLTDKGRLKRLQKGVYCHVKQTVFGPVAPDIDQIVIKSMIVRDGQRIGYESGAALLNQIGLSTLLPRKIEVTTNQYSVKLPERCHVELGKPAALITNRNWKYLQFIDLIESLPDSHTDVEASGTLLTAFAQKQQLDPLTLVFTARKHYSAKTVLRITDLLMEVNDDLAP